MQAVLDLGEKYNHAKILINPLTLNYVGHIEGESQFTSSKVEISFKVAEGQNTDKVIEFLKSKSPGKDYVRSVVYNEKYIILTIPHGYKGITNHATFCLRDIKDSEYTSFVDDSQNKISKIDPTRLTREEVLEIVKKLRELNT